MVGLSTRQPRERQRLELKQRQATAQLTFRITCLVQQHLHDGQTSVQADAAVSHHGRPISGGLCVSSVNV